MESIFAIGYHPCAPRLTPWRLPALGFRITITTAEPVEGVVERIGAGSLVGRAREAIFDSILAGRFPDGRLPPEDELARLLGVSRTTVRAALGVLEHDGVVSRAPRRGTVVRQSVHPSMLALQRLLGFSRLLRERGHEVVVKIKWVVGRPPKSTAERLGIGEKAQCYLMKRLFEADGSPAIFALDVFPVGVLSRQLSPGEPIPESPFELSDQCFNAPIDHAVVEIVPCIAGKQAARELRLPRGQEYVLLNETHYSESNNPIGFSRIEVNDRFVRFHVIRRR